MDGYVAVHVSYQQQAQFARPLTAVFHQQLSGTIAQLKATIREHWRILIREHWRIFVPDQRLMVSFGGETQEAHDGQQLWNFVTVPGEPLSVTLVIEPAQLLLLCGGEGHQSRLCLVDAESEQTVHSFLEPQDTVLCAAVEWSQQYALVGGWEPCLRLWDLSGPRLMRELHYSPPHGQCDAGIFCVAADWVHMRAVSGGQDCVVRLWDLHNGIVLQNLIGHTHPIFSVAFDFASRLVLSGSQDRMLKLWNLDTGDLERNLSGHSGTVFSISVDWHYCRALTGSWDTSLRLWDLTTGQTLKEFRSHKNAIRTCAMNYAMGHAVSSGLDNAICKWELSSGKCLGRIESNDMKSAAFVSSLDVDWANDRVLAAGTDGSIRLFDLQAGSCVRSCPTEISEIRCMHVRWLSNAAQPPGVAMPAFAPALGPR